MAFSVYMPRIWRKINWTWLHLWVSLFPACEHIVCLFVFSLLFVQFLQTLKSSDVICPQGHAGAPLVGATWRLATTKYGTVAALATLIIDTE